MSALVMSLRSRQIPLMSKGRSGDAVDAGKWFSCALHAPSHAIDSSSSATPVGHDDKQAEVYAGLIGTLAGTCRRIKKPLRRPSGVLLSYQNLMYGRPPSVGWNLVVRYLHSSASNSRAEPSSLIQTYSNPASLRRRGRFTTANHAKAPPTNATSSPPTQAIK